VESFAVVIKKYGNRGLYDTAREHSIRLAAASGQLHVSRGVWSANRKLWGFLVAKSLYANTPVA
jgi:hypothetical protein